MKVYNDNVILDCINPRKKKQSKKQIDLIDLMTDFML